MTYSPIDHNSPLSLMGSATRQQNDMRISYRVRGSLVRIQIKTYINPMTLMMNHPFGAWAPSTSLLVNAHITTIIVYSPIKTMANNPPPNSTLTPETSSDSASAKSKGARFVSATPETHHRAPAHGSTLTQGTFPWWDTICHALMVEYSTINPTTTNTITTSYEIVCATHRNPPSSAYTELLPHPNPK